VHFCNKVHLILNHKRLDVYKIAGLLVTESYRISSLLPQEERFSLISQIRRCAISIILNIAEGSSRRSRSERKRFFEIARGSLIELDAALEVCESLNYLSEKDLDKSNEYINRCFGMISRMIEVCEK